MIASAAPIVATFPIDDTLVPRGSDYVFLFMKEEISGTKRFLSLDLEILYFH